MEQSDLGHHILSGFNADLQRLRSSVLEMGGMVEDMLQAGLRSLAEGDSALAEEVLRVEARVNAMEVSLDTECCRILATRAPTASDLRLVVAIIKTVTDLERIGDEARKIGTIGLRFAALDHGVDSYRLVRHLGRASMQLLRGALDVFARLDAKAALEIVKRDRIVDQEYEAIHRQCITFMMEDPRRIRSTIDQLWIARALERIGDHAKNICEYVIYMALGKDVRHVAHEEVEQQIAAAAAGMPPQGAAAKP